MYATLRGISSKSTSFQTYNQNLNSLNTITTEIEALQTNLLEFRYLSSQAQNAANMAKATGDWLQFDEFIDQIGTLGFAEHRQTRSLLNRKDVDQQKRIYLRERVDVLNSLAGKEEFDEALEVLQELGDKQTGDPNDIFGIVGTISYTNPLSNRRIRRLTNVRDHFEASWAQIVELAKWLASAGLRSAIAVDFPDLAKMLPEGEWPQFTQ